MQFSLNIDANKLFAAFNKAPLQVAKELRLAMNKGMQVVVVDAREHHSNFKSHRGNAERSIISQVSDDGLEGKVFINPNYPVGTYLHEGTGLYGYKHAKYKIQAKTAKALYFVKGGTGYMVPSGGTLTKKNYWERDGLFMIGKGYVMHPGIKGEPFVYNAFKRQLPYLQSRLSAALGRAFQIAGFK